MINKEILYRFFKGTATDKECQQIKDWTESSSDNLKILLRERKMFDAVIMSDALQLPKKKYQFVLWKKQMIGIAASIAVIIGLYGLWHHFNSSQNYEGMQVLSVPSGQRANFKLADGTEIWINAGSRLEIPNKFGDKTREITLDGEAYFEVAKDEQKPFIVKTKKANICVKGTGFNVKAFNKDSIFSTSLIHGKVEVMALDADNFTIQLDPNQQVSIVNNTIRKEYIPDYDEFRWREGLICFRELPLRRVLKKIERCYDVRFIIEKKELKDMSLTGKFRFVDGVDHVMKVLQKDVAFNYEKESNSNIIYIK